MPFFQDSKQKKASKALMKGQQDVMDKAKLITDQQQEVYQPFVNFGYESLNRLKDFENATASGDYSMLTSSPEYQFNKSEQENALARRQALTGDIFGGSGLKDIQKYSSGLASNEMQNVRNRLLGNINVGYPAIGEKSNIMGNYLDYYKNARTKQAEARAGKYINSANIWGKAMEDFAKMIG